MKKWAIVLVVVLLVGVFIPLPSFVTSGCGPFEDCPITPGWQLGSSIFVILTSEKQNNTPVPQFPNPPDLKIACNIQECHGPNFTCGEKGVEACDEMYRLGDVCKQFVSCQVVSGKCKTVAPKLSQCKSCVQECSADSISGDPIECMQKCVEKIK